MAATFLASQTRPLWRFIKDQQLDGEAIFREAGLDPELRKEAQARYPLQGVFALWESAVRLSGKHHVPLHLAQFSRITDFHALAIAFQSSSTLRTALQRLVRYHKLINTALEMEVSEEAGQIHLEAPPFETGTTLQQALLEDSRASIILGWCRNSASGEVNPVAAAFTYPQPRDIGEHYGVLKCPVTFSQPKFRLSFSLEDVDKPLTSRNPDLADISESSMAGALEKLSALPLPDRIRRAITDALPSGTPSDDDIASALAMSARTMQRRLAEEDTSFTALLTEVRQQLAQQYISDPNISVTEISYLLGFSDVSSFSRAFKRWTGSPPASYRDNLAG